MKVKILILFTFLLLLPFHLFSQINIQFNGINEYLFNTKEAINLTVINSGAKAVKVQFSGKITSPNKGVVVLFKSSPVTLSVGTNLITPQTISLETIDFQNYDIEEIEQKTGTYPSGAYTLCIWSACTSPDCDGSGPSAGSIEQPVCTTIQVENPTPLLLSYPSDNSEIEETRPTYTWIPPAPIASSSSLNYTMTLVEIYDGQNKTDALAINRPLIEYTGIGNPMLMHPSDLPALEEGKSYAWQVQAYVGQTFFAKSEQWKFKIKKDTTYEKVACNQSHIDIVKQDGSSLFYAVGAIKLRYDSRFEKGEVKLMFKDSTGAEISVSGDDYLISSGANYYSIVLSSNPRFKHGVLYTMSGKLLNGKFFSIKFIYLDPNRIKSCE